MKKAAMNITLHTVTQILDLLLYMEYSYKFLMFVRRINHFDINQTIIIMKICTPNYYSLRSMA